MTKLHRTTCILGLCAAAVVGCAATNVLDPPADCSPVDESWIDTAPRCGEGALYHSRSLPMGADCRVVVGSFEGSDSASTAYPELSQYRAFLGHVNLFQNLNLSDISGLGNLEYVQQFTITNAPLTSLRGLENLRVVTTHFSVATMPTLTSLEGVGRLQSVGGDLAIIGNERLTSLQGLSSLCRVGGNVWIIGNTSLPQWELDAFLDRIEVDGEVTVMNAGP